MYFNSTICDKFELKLWLINSFIKNIPRYKIILKNICVIIHSLDHRVTSSRKLDNVLRQVYFFERVELTLAHVFISQLPKQSVVANMASPQAQFVQNAIKDNKVVIFSKTYCPYCTMAKDQFKKLSIDFHVVELDKRDDGDEIQTILGEITGGRTVPRCFIDGKFVGGGTDVKKMYEQGTLQTYFT